MIDYSKYGPYTKMDEDVVGSGKRAVAYLPPELQKIAEKAAAFLPEETEVVRPGTFDWREGIRLTKRAKEAKSLRQGNIYESLRLAHMKQRTGRDTPEFHTKASVSIEPLVELPTAKDAIKVTPEDVAKAKANVDMSALSGFSAVPEAAEVAGAVAAAVVNKIEEAKRKDAEQKAAVRNQRLIKVGILVVAVMALAYMGK